MCRTGARVRVLLAAATLCLLAASAVRAAGALTFDDIAAGLMSFRSRLMLKSLRCSYTVSYRGENWGWMQEADGRYARRDDPAGEYSYAIEGIDSGECGEHAKRYLSLKEARPGAPQMSMVHNGRYSTRLEVPLASGTRPSGLVTSRSEIDELSLFDLNGELPTDLTYTVFNDPWEHALKTGPSI